MQMNRPRTPALCAWTFVIVVAVTPFGIRAAGQTPVEIRGKGPVAPRKSASVVASRPSDPVTPTADLRRSGPTSRALGVRPLTLGESAPAPFLPVPRGAARTENS